MSFGRIICLRATTEEEARREAHQYAQTNDKKLVAIMENFPHMTKPSISVQLDRDGHLASLAFTPVQSGDRYWTARFIDHERDMNEYKG
jgi:hypothetical protein